MFTVGLPQSGGNALLAVLLTTAFLVSFGGNFVILGMLYREKREKSKKHHESSNLQNDSQVSI